MQRKRVYLGIAAVVVAGLAIGAYSYMKFRANPINRLVLPSGLSVELVAKGLRDARQLALSKDERTLFVGTRKKGVVYRVRLNEFGTAQSVEVLLDGLTMPSGIALRDQEGREDLYVSAMHEIWVVENAIGSNQARLLTDALPDQKHHGWRYLRFGPDGMLYVPVGAPCNACLSEDPKFASILRVDPDTGTFEVFAKGVRNSLGLAFHPVTGQLWFTENGRDLLGDDIPPDEVNVVTAGGQHYGFPYIHAGSVPDPEFGEGADQDDYVRPVFNIQAHSAALGLVFNTSSQLGESWKGAVLIAEHGSWNRTEMVGYQVSALLPDTDGNVSLKPFITGFLQNGKAWGRPNDLLITRDGHLLISDDQFNAVLRIHPD